MDTPEQQVGKKQGAGKARFPAWLVRWFRAAEDGAEPGALMPRFFLLFLVLFAGGMALISMVGDQGLISYYRLQGEATQLRADVAALKTRRAELTREITALREDSSYIEFLARRKLGLVKPGDTVIQLPLGQGGK